MSLQASAPTFRILYEVEWAALYRAFKRARTHAFGQLNESARIGATYAQGVQGAEHLPATERRRRIAGVRRQFDEVVRAAARLRTHPRTGGAYTAWMNGYFEYKVTRYPEAWALYQSAAEALADDPLYLLDFGRLAYNTGSLHDANHLFNLAATHWLEIPADKQPLQVIRWLAKLSRLIGDTEGERFHMEDLKRFFSDPGTKQRCSPDDIRASRAFFYERAPGLLFELGEPHVAWPWIEGEIGSNTPDQQLHLALLGVDVLLALGRTQDAEAFAGVWTDRLGRPAPVVRFLKAAGHPFSARTAFIRRAEAAAATPDGSVNHPAGMVYLDAASGTAEAVAPPPGATSFWIYAEEAFAEGLAEEGLDLALRAATAALEGGAAVFLATVLHSLHHVRRTLSDFGRLAALFDEAATTFPDDPFVQLQVGFHYLDTAPAEQALAHLQRACRLADADPRTNATRSHDVFLAEALARSGNIEQALALFRTALPACTPGEAPIVYGRAARWAAETGRFDLALDWTRDFLAGEGSAVWTTSPAREPIEAGARAALALGDFDAAAMLYERLVANYAHHYAVQRTRLDRDALRTNARPLALCALAHALAGDAKRAGARLALATIFDPDHDAIPVAAAAVALRNGDVATAVEALDSDAPPAWLLRTLGPPVLEAAHVANVDPDRLAALQLRVDRASGTLPTVEELLVDARLHARSLSDAQAQAESERQAHLALQSSVDGLVAEMAEENARLGAVAEARRQAVVDAENRLLLALEDLEDRPAPGAGTPPPEADTVGLIRDAFPSVSFAAGAAEAVAALRGASRKSVLRTLGIAQNAPGNLNVRDKTVDLGSRGTAYEVAYPGNGNDSGRLYLTGGGTSWTVACIGYKSTQKKDIQALKRG